MGLFSGIYTGRESLMSHGEAMNVIADNLANSNTPGFKGQRAEFQDILADSVGSLFGSPLQSGEGVAVDDIYTIHAQGPIDFTSRELDVAINGQGFFVLNDGTNNFYSRAGNFALDAEGNLVSATGENVLGFTAESPDTAVPLNLTATTSQASPTTTAALFGNLDATELDVVPPASPATFNELNNAASFRTSVGVFDSLGIRHEISFYFFKTANLNWQVDAYVPDTEVGGTTGAPTQVGTTQLTFDATGIQPEGSAAALALSAAWGNGAAASSVAFDLSGMTDFGAESGLTSVTADGNPTGQVVGTDITADGAIAARLDNGESIPIGTLALALFSNVNGLERVGENRFQEGADSGAAELGNPGTEGRGTTQGGSLEGSNVDSANEFIRMITIQRGYQAGAQVITTIDGLIDTTIQIA